MASYPEMVDILVATFHHACAFTVPQHILKPQGLDNDAYKKLLGFRSGETQERFYERMAGILTLYGAVVQTNIPRQAGLGANPHGIGCAWAWLARMANLKPRKITATCLISFLTVAGYEMSLLYGKQFGKLLDAIQTWVVPNLPADAPPGPAARLRLFIQDFNNNGRRLREPKGKTMPISDAENL
eukprot:Plantae.Rhodophyta-Rhodochaete_pulchella.ctg16478.p1 GENE.Plantae.Rhodophyta-Rhodochaete_pulchella.ctg16478~~Plantae.Rhodophyta-Rhodochaete_pulchella.ctg16478.p1  ORF type:complete len:208 (+),score=30.31 Plantae.Rhodophyta-Rhodochaete_pulchella.ctg16478:70-624(+)